MFKNIAFFKEGYLLEMSENICQRHRRLVSVNLTCANNVLYGQLIICNYWSLVRLLKGVLFK